MNANKLFFLLIFLTMSVTSQNRLKEKQEQIKSIKVAFITNELSLTPDEAAKFWPVYNTFEDKQVAIRKTKLKGYINRLDDETFDNLSEKEATTLLTQLESAEDDLFQLKKKFNAELRNVLAASKILKLKKAEEKFNRKLMQQFRDKRGR